MENSFFTHFLVEGLRTGAADRNNDGLIHIDELYDHIREGMAKQSRQQIPLKFSLQAAGDLIIAHSPISPFQRAREQLTDIMVQAEKAAERGDYSRAETLLTQVITAEPEGLLGISTKQMLDEIMVEYDRAVAYNDVKRLAGRSERAAYTVWQAFTRQYPNYDPDNLAKQVGAVLMYRVPTSPPPPQQQQPSVTKKSQVLQASDILPAPFTWIEIPDKGYSIAKYPLTNAQFAPFIEAGGYQEKKWWTEAGWEYRQKEKWTEPRYWKYDKWNGAEQPVVGVSWYEAVAYCLWLSQKTGQKIVLPTERQWQYAAQGQGQASLLGRLIGGRNYPWGNEWGCNRCNNSVTPCKSNATTPVTRYEGKGDSPFGVVDMAGNVWEWCLTDYENKTNDVNSQAKYRVLRGGSWDNYDSDYFRVSYHNRNFPNVRINIAGFRLALS